MLPGARSHRHRVGAAALAAAAVLLGAGAAHAQTSSPSHAEDDRRARAEFTAGRDAFTRGDYDTAVRRFESAYALSRRPQLLYNLGTTYDRLHRWTDARDAFQSFLAALPEAPEREEVSARLRVIEQEIARQQAEAQGAATPAQGAVRERVIVRVVPAEPPHVWRTTGFVLGGLAVLSGVASGAIALFTNSYYLGLRQDCGDMSRERPGCAQAAIDDVALRAGLINLFLGGAIGLAALSGGSFVLDAATSGPRHDATPRGPTVSAALAPVLAPPSAGGGLTGGMVVFTGAL